MVMDWTMSRVTNEEKSLVEEDEKLAFKKLFTWIEK